MVTFENKHFINIPKWLPSFWWFLSLILLVSASFCEISGSYFWEKSQNQQNVQNLIIAKLNPPNPLNVDVISLLHKLCLTKPFPVVTFVEQIKTRKAWKVGKRSPFLPSYYLSSQYLSRSIYHEIFCISQTKTYVSVNTNIFCSFVLQIKSFINLAIKFNSQ